jgi:hypothetical protein
VWLRVRGSGEDRGSVEGALEAADLNDVALVWAALEGGEFDVRGEVG